MYHREMILYFLKI